MSVWNLQKAVYGILSGDPALNAIVSGIYDFVPDNSQFPYIVVKIEEISDWTHQLQDGFAVNIETDIFCKDKGNKVCLQIFDNIYGLLHDAVITVEGSYALQNIRLVSARMHRKTISDIYGMTCNFSAKMSK